MCSQGLRPGPQARAPADIAIDNNDNDKNNNSY